jgi:Holliday junction DNA helicase RuvA
MLSALNAERLVRAIRGKDVALLVTIPRIGRKKAEQIVLDLADKLDELAGEEDAAPATNGRGTDGGTAEDAVRALVTLGYTSADSERAVREALRGGARGRGTAEIIRQALAFASGSTRN